MGAYLASMFLVPLLAAELMTDQERVLKIEALQPLPNPGNDFTPSENVEITGLLKTEDGQPLPKSLFFEGQQNLKQPEAKVTSLHGGGWSGGGISLDDPRTHLYYGNTLTGRIELGVWAEGYAPARKTILQAHGGKVEVDLTLQRGFPAHVRVIGPNGQSLPGVTLIATSTQRETDSLEVTMPPVQTDASGTAIFGNVEADSEIHLNAFKSGWQMTNPIISQWTSGTPFVCILEPAQSTAGVVLDRATRRPIAGAEIILAARRGAGDSYVAFAPENGQVLGHSNENGRFNLENLARNPSYYIYVQADGYPAQSFPITYGEHNRVCELSRGFRLRGKILDPQGLLESRKNHHPIELQVMYDLQATPFNGYGMEKRLSLPKLGAEIPFDFENVPPGRIQIAFGIFGLEDYRYELNLQKNMDDYIIHFDVKPPTSLRDVADSRPLRQLVFSFRTDSGDLPTGVLDATYLSNSGEEKWVTPKVAPIAGGQASVNLPVPTQVGLFADHLVGYWFAPESFDLPSETGVFQRTINAVRAGVIHGNASPSPKFKNQSLSVLPIVIRPPPGLIITDLTSGNLNFLSAKNEYVTQPLPFGGSYAVIVAAAPSYFVSESALVDVEHPIVVRDIDLKLPTGILHGQFVDETNKPITYQEVILTYHPDENDSFSSHSATTDADGGFSISGVNFALPGNYEVQIYGDSWAKTTIRVNGHTPQPLVISLRHHSK